MSASLTIGEAEVQEAETATEEEQLERKILEVVQSEWQKRGSQFRNEVKLVSYKQARNYSKHNFKHMFVEEATIQIGSAASLVACVVLIGVLVDKFTSRGK